MTCNTLPQGAAAPNNKNGGGNLFKPLMKVLTIGVLLAPASVLAVPITVDFTITNSSAYIGSTYNGYAVGGTTNGSFTFDDALGTFENASAGSAAIDLSLNWLGASFDESNTQIWQLRFDSLGALTGWALGGANCAFNCINSAGPSDLYVTGGAPYNGTSAGHVEGVNGWMVGSVTSWSSHPASVPEPGTLGLLGVGLLAASAARRKRAA